MLKKDKPFKSKAPPNNPPHRLVMSNRLVKTGLRFICALAFAQYLIVTHAAVDATSSPQVNSLETGIPTVRVEDPVLFSVVSRTSSPHLLFVC